MLQLRNDLDIMCKRKVKVNAGMRKNMVFESLRDRSIDGERGMSILLVAMVIITLQCFIVISIKEASMIMLR